MKAIVQKGYGSPDILTLEDIAKPVPRDDEVLIRVVASSLNAADVDFLRGTLVVRFAGLRGPRFKVPGTDVAGRIESVGKEVTRFEPGDEVFGDLFEFGHGTFAEYVCAPEKAVTRKPAELSFEDAATLPQAGILGLQGVGADRPRSQRYLRRCQGPRGQQPVVVAMVYAACKIVA